MQPLKNNLMERVALGTRFFIYIQTFAWRGQRPFNTAIAKDKTMHQQLAD
jgi:hypothetical protein